MKIFRPGSWTQKLENNSILEFRILYAHKENYQVSLLVPVDYFQKILSSIRHPNIWNLFSWIWIPIPKKYMGSKIPNFGSLESWDPRIQNKYKSKCGSMDADILENNSHIILMMHHHENISSRILDTEASK